MNSTDAKKFVEKVFDLITKSSTTQDLENILDEMDIPKKNRMDSNTYPQINFKIDKKDINTLIKKNLINKNTLAFENNISENISDPLSKLLYSTLWKNGDLKKIKHIISGILNIDNEAYSQDDALVFFQFGKHLTKKNGEPIIDQHVIRAFAVKKSNDLMQIEKNQKIELLKKDHKHLIKEYIDWLRGSELNETLKSIPNYSYHIDKVLFATGKTIKQKKNT
jgi:hypothetical protein